MLEINFRIAGRVALPAALAAGLMAGCQDAGATITRLTVGTPGPDPYVKVAGTDRKVGKPANGGGVKAGSSPGLYGGTRQATVCDADQLIAFLQGNPGKARVWAKAQGIRTGAIPAFVGGLTPVLLRTDTLVTNHGYRNGKATSSPAVLQAGMGVMINKYGVPAVKCNCGNPLTAPDKDVSPEGADYTGTSWPGFTKEKVTKVKSQDPVKDFVLIDTESGTGFERPAGTEGDADGATTEPTPSPSPSVPPGGTGTGEPTGPVETPEPEPEPTGGPTLEPSSRPAPRPTIIQPRTVAPS